MGRRRLGGFCGWVVVLGAWCALGGCNTSLREAQQLYRMGDIQGAREKIVSYSDEETGSSPQTVIAWIERGSILRTAGDFRRSTRAFTVATDRMDQLDLQAETDLGGEFEALLTNPEQITYRGTGYDRVLAPMYMGMNFLADGNLDNPRQAFIKASQRQDETIQRNRAEIERRERSIQESRGKEVDLDRAREDRALNQMVRERYGDLEAFEPYEGYAIPFADLVRAIYLMGVREDPSDVDTARGLLRRVAGMTDEQPYVMDDLEMADAGVFPETGLTYVLFETGVAPYRAQRTIDLPLWIVSNNVDYVGLAIPYLVFSDRFAAGLRVETIDGSFDTLLVTDMDRVVAADFKQQLPSMMERMVASAAVKAAASYGVNQATQGNDWVNLAARLVMIGYQSSQNVADRRTWATLPKQYQYCRFPTPADGAVTLQLEGQGPRSVEVEPGGMSVVVVRSIGPGGPTRVHSFRIE